jgi:hypothetical protein
MTDDHVHERLEIRVAQLELLLDRLTGALLREGKEEDGSFGFPPFEAELAMIKDETRLAVEDQPPIRD